MSSHLLDDGLGGGDGPVAGINVTPMVDVMLCLLIIFMVSAPLLGPQAPMEISIPRAFGSAVAEEQFLLTTISVDKNGGVFLGTVALASDPVTLAAELSNNAKLKADQIAFIQGDENISFDRIVDVLVALRTAGVSKVGFLTDPRAEAAPAK